MLIINSDTAGLLAQILPAFIVLFVVEQHRLTVATGRRHHSAEEELLAAARKSGLRQALLVSNVVSLMLCVFFVQIGSKRLEEMQQTGDWDNWKFSLAAAGSLFIYVSTLVLFIFLAFLAYQIAFDNMKGSPLWQVALNESAATKDRESKCQEQDQKGSSARARLSSRYGAGSQAAVSNGNRARVRNGRKSRK